MRTSKRIAALLTLCAPLLLLSSCEDSVVTAPMDGQIILTANPSVVTLDPNANPPITSGSSTITARVFDSRGYALQDVAVTFSSSGGTLASAGPPGQPPTQLTTDANGQVVDVLTLTTNDGDMVDVTVLATTLQQSVTVVKDEILPNQRPIADLFATPASSQSTNSAFVVDGTGSVDPEGDTLTCYRWQISPVAGCTQLGTPCPAVQESSSLTQLILRYSAVTSVSVQLRVSDDPTACSGGPFNASLFGPSASLAYDITCNSCACDVTPPVAEAGSNRTLTLGVNASVSANLNGTGSFDDEVAITAWSWDCGNGTMANGAMATCTYTVPAVYTVTLTATNACGATATDTLTVTVNP